MSSIPESSLFVYMGPDGDPVPRNVQNVRVHQSVTIIPESAFLECIDLVKVELPEGLLRIEAGAFKRCKSLRGISIPSSVIRIGSCAFAFCHALRDVELSEGIQDIEEQSFIDCKSLLRISIPSSVTRICYLTFAFCHALRDVELSESIQDIGVQSFMHCTSLLRISIPSSVTRICYCAFAGCCELRDVELCEGIQDIEEQSFMDCRLFCIKIPSSVTMIGNCTFAGCNLLRNVSISPRSTITMWFRSFQRPAHNTEIVLESFQQFAWINQVRGIKHRFDRLPIHELCCSCVENKSDQLKLLVNSADDVESALLQHDCLGMRPLHVLACSGSHDASSLEFLVQQCPKALASKDYWGGTPLEYLLLSEAPLDMISLFLRQHHDKLGAPYFGNVMLKLATMKKGISDVFLRHVVCTLRQCIPNLDIDWEHIIAVVKQQEDDVRSVVSQKVFRVLVEASASKQLNCLALIHHTELQDHINKECNMHDRRFHEQQRLEYDKNEAIIWYCVRRYCQKIEEATTLVELFAWKVKMNYTQCNNIRQRLRKQPRVEARKKCHDKCGVDIIIPNVLPFL